MKIILSLLLLQLTMGCSSFQWSYEQEENSVASMSNLNSINESSINSNSRNPSSNTQPQSVHFYAEKLAEQFFITSENIDMKKTIAVGTFLPINNMNGNSLPQANPIAHQLQESFVTIAAQVGLKVIEFKTMSQLKIKNNQDIMLSRNVEELASTINADYYLTGTYSEHKDKLVINVRLIELPTNIVVAAATDYIPADVMEYQSKIKLKENKVYRGAY